MKPYLKEIREFVIRYLKQHPCISCGETDPCVLDFDHIDPAIKEYNVSRLISGKYSLQKIKEEIKKCQVLCSNCHRRKTSISQNWFYNDFVEEN